MTPAQDAWLLKMDLRLSLQMLAIYRHTIQNWNILFLCHIAIVLLHPYFILVSGEST